MDAIVFAAGRGTRLQPLTDETPKPLLEVAGKPLLEWCLEAVVDAGIDDLVIVVGYRGEQILDAIGDSFEGVPISYAHQRERRGLAHAVYTAAEQAYDIVWSSDSVTVPDAAPTNVMTVNGDNVFEGCALSRLRKRHAEPEVDGTLALDLRSRNEATATARCEINADGGIRSIKSHVAETTSSTGTEYIAAGVQTHEFRPLLEACLALEQADSGEYELTDALCRLVDDARYLGLELSGWHRNVNTPADLEAARARFRS